jgi:hypothetical protein
LGPPAGLIGEELGRGRVERALAGQGGKVDEVSWLLSVDEGKGLHRCKR